MLDMQHSLRTRCFRALGLGLGRSACQDLRVYFLHTYIHIYIMYIHMHTHGYIDIEIKIMAASMIQL